jgi:uncharacterized membrane protein
MERMLVVFFDSETKAYEGRNTLLDLDNEGSISVLAYAVLSKSNEGKVSVKQSN